MKKPNTVRQRPLFHEGPDWQQLDESLRQQVIHRLADICHDIASSPVNSLPSEKEQLDDDGKD